MFSHYSLSLGRTKFIDNHLGNTLAELNLDFATRVTEDCAWPVREALGGTVTGLIEQTLILPRVDIALSFLTGEPS